MKITGVLIFLLMACFDRVGRGGLRPFFGWISKHLESTSIWRTKLAKVEVSANLMLGIGFFIHVIPFLEPRIYMLGVVHPPPVVAYSDAAWTAHHPPLLPSRGLGRCIFQRPEFMACSLVTPTDVLLNLEPRQTQIIPLELIAAAGLLRSYREQIQGSEVILFICNQSVCGGLAKGSSQSRDIQHLSTGFHSMCAVRADRLQRLD